MKFLGIGLAVSVYFFSRLQAQERHFENVPTIRIQSARFISSDKAAENAAYADCNNQMTEAYRLLKRKGVEIILDESACKRIEETLNESAYFEARLYFMN